jgi:DNA-binding NarL/FixJ family response regulator
MELLEESAEGVGYLLKDRVSEVGDFADAVRRVAEGGSALDPAIVTRLVGRNRRFLGRQPSSKLRGRRADVTRLP